MTLERFRELALSLDGTTEQAHFDRIAFKVIKKRIFATLDLNNRSANLKLSEIDQSVFSSFNKAAVYPVPNKWGLQGWTTFELDKLSEELVADALNAAYHNVFEG